MKALAFAPDTHGFIHKGRTCALYIRPVKFWGWQLAIWQQRWQGTHPVRFRFASPVAAAHYGFDFIKTQWTPYPQVLAERGGVQ